ncbi:VOC family protein [Carboxylicivirga caseinilyticus]|uniref:VOC family protein n=1 Tax=Carboxylicivirga caseinilyticus TaxID=3417572 RepID=UPI003D35080A|nr:VOC family protein [Marinilabiliaceae bacterium A049]
MMKIDHIGIVVRSLEEGINQWKDNFGYSQMTKPTLNTRQKVNIVFMEKENSITIKLIEPSEDESPMFQFAKKGGGLHHLCFIVDELVQEIDILQNKGLFLISPPQPGEAFGNNNIAFLLGKNNLNIELIDTNIKSIKLSED